MKLTPLCKCGCGERTKISKHGGGKIANTWLNGHYARWQYANDQRLKKESDTK